MIKIFGDFCQFSAEKIAFFSKTNVTINLFTKSLHFFAKKIGENKFKNHNVGPSLGEFSPIGRLFSLGSFYYYESSPKFRLLFPQISLYIQFDKNGSGYILGDFFLIPIYLVTLLPFGSERQIKGSNFVNSKRERGTNKKKTFQFPKSAQSYIL
jgi:hypothetical protein